MEIEDEHVFAHLAQVVPSNQELPSPAKEWLQAERPFNEADLRGYWAKEVPKLFSPEVDCDCLNITYDENAVEKILFQPLDIFVTGQLDSQTLFTSLKGLDGPPKLCGRLFKNGEPTYSCKDCGFDPTCVLCVDCFTSSTHRYHKYRMSMSGGGGYCDCGDTEAWKADPFCENHLRGHEADKSKDKFTPESLLPPGVADRVRMVMRTSLRYCFELLTYEMSTRCPPDLVVEGPESPPEMYATMLFNDEIHTYEQVISTLSRAIECSQKEAIDFATTIDREGRSIVKCSSFQSCQDVKRTIERITSRHNSKPLRVEVMAIPLIAHQTMAMRLLTWMQTVVNYCEGFRQIFSSVISERYTSNMESTLLENIMRSDVSLWKTARNQWHQLFITGLLMESESKRQFAKVFTRIYSSLMKDFVTDDHEHSVSITSLSVQLYTVPSLGHTLIAEDDALVILVKSFLEECRKYQNHDGKLQFERNHAQMMNFRRSQYILIDLRYLLSAKPISWTESMRKNFLQAFVNLVDLMDWMQGMDAVVRQVGQHVEFEAEWETGINLQLKLSHVISLVIEWAGSDRIVLLKALKHALKELEAKQGKMTYTSRSLMDSKAEVIEYDVSSLPVSVHLPLTRLVAGLLLHLSRYDVNYNSPDFLVDRKSTLVELMELPLRTLVMIAQYHAGMWRRNGYSLVNQVFFYHNVRLREEMYDRDILMLQYVAALTPSDEFLVHLIHKFNLLIVWSVPDDQKEPSSRKPDEDYNRQTITLIEDFVSLLLVLVSERHNPGVGKVTLDDRIKKEIIQWLSVEPLTHSDLLKYLPKDTINEVVVENLINEVAEFKRPGNSIGVAGGKYEVRNEYLKDFNPFFYHYTRQDQSTAEEVQLKRKKMAGETFICCPPPPPPELTAQFHDLKHILDSDIMVHIIHVLLKRTLLPAPYATNWSETQYEKILHLIGVALHEEDRTISQIMEDPTITETQPNFDFLFVHKCLAKGIYPQLLEDCLKSQKATGHRDLLRWVIDKFNQVYHRRGYNVSDKVSHVATAEPSTSKGEGFTGYPDKKRNAETAAKRRARIIAQMLSQQQSFLKENAHFFKDMSGEELMSGSSSLIDFDPVMEPVAVGTNQRGRVIQTESQICILCREEQEVTANGRCLVLAAFVQRSTVLSRNRERKVNFTDEAVEAIFMPSDLYFGPHVSTCGHVMHSDCWQKYFESVLAKERRRPVRYVRHVSYDVDKGEFLCPLCECLSNTIIPVLPPAILPLGPPNSVDIKSDISMDDWLTALHSVVEGSQPIWIKDPSMNIETGEKYICRLKPATITDDNIKGKLTSQFIELCQSYEKISQSGASGQVKLSQPILEMMTVLAQAIYTVGLNVHNNTEDDRVPVISYWSCAFTIHSIERVLRDEGKTIFSDLSSRKFNCLQALIRYVANSSGVVSAAVIRTHALKLLKYLLINESHAMSPTSFLDIDAFGLLVSLVMSSPSIYVRQDDDDPGSILTPPTGNAFDRNFLNLVLTLQLMQVILTKESPVGQATSVNDTPEPMDTGDGGPTSLTSSMSMATESFDSQEVEVLTSFVTQILEAAGLPGKWSLLPVGQELVIDAKKSLLPLLRCSALLFHFLTSISPPTLLRESTSLPSDDGTSTVEFDSLTKYLGLATTFDQLLSSQQLRQLVLNWVRHPRVHLLTSNTVVQNKSPTEIPLKLIRQPHDVNQLISLPRDFSELINSVSQFSCPNSDVDDSRSPTMCLVCGTMLCSQSYCCQTELDSQMVGACTYHSHFCGAGVGLFLRIRDCKVLLLAGKTKGCYLPPPFIDEFGETDQGLVRGNPLHLCQSSYNDLHRLWLRHGIPEQIAHALELSSNMSATNWGLH